MEVDCNRMTPRPDGRARSGRARGERPRRRAGAAGKPSAPRAAAPPPDLEGALARAARLRAALFGPFGAERDTNAYRLLNGAGDGFPGLAADAYAGHIVLGVSEPAAAPLAARVEEELERVLKPLSIVRKLRFAAEERGHVAEEVTCGQAPAGPLEVREAGVPFAVELTGSLHTGLFTDLREERARLRGLAAGRKVLNTFAYTGAFSVAAALGGAIEVTSVDVVAKVLERARHNFALSGIDPERHRFARMDVLDHLGMAARRAWRFGAIVLDPPTFASFRGGTWSARNGYPELLRRTLAVLEPEGLLWAVANTEGIPAARFEEWIAAALREAGRSARIIAAGGLPPDYPTPAGDGQARYLKVQVLVVG
jgi:23S rRNA (cytosine1962-C5)-methyltransferase